MTTATRTHLIPQILGLLEPGDRLTTAEITDGLLDAGHTFGGLAPDPGPHDPDEAEDPDEAATARLVALTALTLDRLLERGQVVEGDPLGGQRTWHLPVAHTAAADPSAASAQPAEATRVNVAAAAFLVAQAVLGVLILLIGTLRDL